MSKKGIEEPFFWLEPISKFLGLSHIETVMLLVYSILIILAIIARLQLPHPTKAPTKTLPLLFEIFVEALENFLTLIVGKHARKILPFVAALALFICFSNLIGLIPGLFSPTSNLNTNAALAICVLFSTYVYGIRSRGWKILKIFTGPKWYYAPFIMPFAIMDIVIRPFTLTVRLFANMVSKHLLLSCLAFLTICIVGGGIKVVLQTLGIPLVMPLLVLFLGLITCFMQTFVFIILSTIYISEAIGEEH